MEVQDIESLGLDVGSSSGEEGESEDHGGHGIVGVSVRDCREGQIYKSASRAGLRSLRRFYRLVQESYI